MIITRHERSAISGRHEYTRESAAAWGIPQLQADFEAQPPKMRQETRERVLRILAAERASRRPPSALARIAAAAQCELHHLLGAAFVPHHAVVTAAEAQVPDVAEDRNRRPVRNFEGGMFRRLGMMLELVDHPRAVAADEGLDITDASPLRHAHGEAALVDAQSQGFAHAAPERIGDPLPVENDLAGFDGRCAHASADSFLGVGWR
mgnify:CR=1 FL=1